MLYWYYNEWQKPLCFICGGMKWLKELGVFIDNVEYGKVNGENTLTIVLDSEEIIPLNTVVMATRILNPILDKLDLIDESYMLDVYAKPKGEE